jgi:Fur family transcriptional regulator, ferric uptake regulator
MRNDRGPTAGPHTAKRRRTTAKQRDVLEVLASSDNFRSAQQLHLQICQQRPHPIGLTSVYRILRSLTEERIAETQRAEDGETLYRLRSSAAHRHYLLCRLCGYAVAFTPIALEEHTSRLSRVYNYTDVTHHIDLYGICPSCRTDADNIGGGNTL